MYYFELYQTLFTTVQKYEVGKICKMFIKEVFYAHQGYIYLF